MLWYRLQAHSTGVIDGSISDGWGEIWLYHLVDLFKVRK
jgi:hypothetical protein